MKLPLTISLLTVAAVTAVELKPNQCVISGCSGQICAAKSRVTTCEWREEYACYKGATCEIQENGLCGWTMTDKLKNCLNPDIKPAECKKTGCSGQICSDQDLVSTCEWREEYACYGSATCEHQGDGQCGWTQTEELQTCLNSGTPTIPVDPVDNTCKKTGCSGQICSDQDVASTCEWTDSYACYQDATCERQADGQCGWTQTEELQSCLNPEANTSPEDNTCKKTGCSGQVCSDQDVMTTCEWREEYACYGSATCERQVDGQCGWTQTEELQTCLNDPKVGTCVVGGCSGEICGEYDTDGLISSCIWLEEYACYSGAACERQADGQCGWTQTKELEECLIEKADSGLEEEFSLEETEVYEPSNCVVGGCSGQLCGEEDPDGGLISTCEWRDEYACYGSATCERQADGQCGWTMTQELEECLSSPGSNVAMAEADEPGN